MVGIRTPWSVRLRRSGVAVAAVAGGVLLAGCARVDPRPDYQQAQAWVEQSTGAQRLFDPQRRAEDAELVSRLLEDGLTADEAVQVALLNNAGLQEALYEIGVARADLVQAGLLSNPVLGVAFRLPAGGGLANIDLDLAQNIAELWQMPVRKRIARRDLERTIFQVAQQAVATATEARRRYYAAVAADRRLEIARQNVVLSEEVLELTRFRRQAGAGSELDVNLARGVVLEARRQSAELRLEASSARRALADQLGLSLRADELELRDPLPDPPGYRIDPQAAVTLALQRRLDLRAAREAAAAAEQALVLEYRRIFPTLEVGVAMERDARQRQGGRKLLADTARASIAAGRLSAPDIQPRSERQRERRKDVITGPLISLELPVFDQNVAGIARARLIYEQRQRTWEGLVRRLHQQVRDALDRAETAWDVARFYREQILPQASQSLEMARDAYRAGKVSILAVLDAQRTWLTVRQAYIDALERAATGIPELELAVGARLEDLLQVTTRPATQPATQRRTTP